MVGPEILGMEIGLHEAGMARGRRTPTFLHVASLAVSHPEIGGNGLVVIVALHAIHHFGKSQVSQARARGHGVVARGAIQVELLPGPEVSDMAEFQVDSHAGHDVRRDQAAVFCKSRVLDFLGRVASAAIGGRRIDAERWLHTGLRVAHGALGVSGKSRKYSLCVKLMAEGAVRPKAGFGIDPALGIHVAGVGKLEQNRALFLVARKWEQRVRAGGRKAGVALVTNFLIQVRAKGFGVTRHALIVAGAP